MKTARSGFNKVLTVEQWLKCIGQGWRDIVRPLVEYCADHDVPIFQIKEKFGGLRFYAPVDERLDIMIEAAELACSKTCEECGQAGILRGGGWLRTLCDEHAGDREAYVEPTT